MNIQGKLSEASLKLTKFLEIMSDPKIQVLVEPENKWPDSIREILDHRRENNQNQD